MPSNSGSQQENLPKGIFLRGRSYYVAYRDLHGKRIRKSLGPDLEAALKEYARLTNVTERPALFDSLVERWLFRHELRSRPKTIREVGFSKKRLLEAFGGLDAREINEDRVQAFVIERGKSVGAESVNKDLKNLKAILRLAVRQQILPALPCHIEMLPAPLKRRIPQAISAADFNILLETADRLDSQEKHPIRGPILRMAYFTGLRHQELMHLDWSDVDFVHLLVCVRAKPAEDFIPKSHSERDVPIPASLAQYLSDYREKLEHNADRDPVFQPTIIQPRKRGHPLRWYNVVPQMRKLFRAAGLAGPGRPVGLHALRHSYCTNLARSGADIEQVRALAGHSSFVVTQRYFWSTTESRRAAAAGMFKMLGESG